MDYKNGKIYTIRSHQTDKYYIGSTCTMLSKRLSKHKASYKNGTYSIVRQEKLVKYNDCYIELLEAFECNNKDELRKREGELIRKYKDNIVNCKIECRTTKQYNIDNKEKIKIYKSQYYEDNKEKISKQKKQYRIDNREKLSKQRKQSYVNNKKKLKQKYNCECGGKYTKRKFKQQHLKTKKHQKFLKLL